MSLKRKDVKTALYQLLAAAYPWKRTENRLRIWSEIPAADQPAGCLFAQGESRSQPQAFNLPKKEFQYGWMVCFRNEAQDDQYGQDLIEDMLDALDTSLETLMPDGSPLQPGNNQTLGLQYVVNAWIDGEIWIDTGVLDQQGVVLVPIRVLTGI